MALSKTHRVAFRKIGNSRVGRPPRDRFPSRRWVLSQAKSCRVSGYFGTVNWFSASVSSWSVAGFVTKAPQPASRLFWVTSVTKRRGHRTSGRTSGTQHHSRPKTSGTQHYSKRRGHSTTQGGGSAALLDVGVDFSRLALRTAWRSDAGVCGHPGECGRLSAG